MTLALWRGEFGNHYVQRNPATVEAIAAREKLWISILNTMLPERPKSVLEFGANVGINLKALRRILSNVRRGAVEPNMLAQQLLVESKSVEHLIEDIRNCDTQFDLAFTSGVLIHIPPDDLLETCREIHRVSSRWIVAIEYFSHEPQEVEYRGAMGRLWKRDFGAFYLDNFPDLNPIGCGFAWKRMTGLDDLTWWVFEKR